MKAILALAFLAVVLAANTAFTGSNVCKGPTVKTDSYSNATCPTLNTWIDGVADSSHTWTYTSSAADTAGCLHFQVWPVPGQGVGSAMQWTVSATQKGVFTTSNIGTSPVTASGVRAIVLSIDAQFLNSGDADDEITFTVKLSNTGAVGNVYYSVALWRGGAKWDWSEVGVEGGEGVAKDVGIPCCGSTVSSNVIYGEEHEHIYLDAKVTAVQGKFDHANMINAALLSIPDQASFSKGNEVHVRTCVSNQSCSIKGANYYVTVTTATGSGSENKDMNVLNGDAWYTLNPTYRASATSVGLSAAAIFATVVAALL